MSRDRLGAALLLPLAVLIAVQVLFAARDGAPLAERALWGTDGYMRLARVAALRDSGDWYASAVARSNAPYGETLHWTRPFDALVLAGAAALTPLLGGDAALYWWGVLISPLLHVVALAALLWAARPLFDVRGLVCLGVVAAVQPAILLYFAAGRPDHHSLIGLLFVGLAGWTLRLVARRFAAAPAVGAGAIAAALIWVSVEGLLAVALVFAALGLGWIAERERFADKIALFAATLAAGLALALVAERPWAGLAAVEHDRLSIVHLFVFAVVAAAAATVRLADRRTALCASAPRRAAVALAAAAAAAAATLLVFPRFFASPLADADPRVVALLFDNVFELRPLIDAGAPLRSLREVVFYLGPALVAVPYLAVLLGRAPPEARRQWGFVALALAAYLPLSLAAARWTPYAEFLVVLPYGALLARVLAALGRSLRRPAAARAAAVVAFAFGFVVLAALIGRLQPATADTPDCPATAMARHLARADGLGAAPRRVLSFIFYGPELLYRTPHAVVGTPYHRNAAGMLDTYRFFAAADAEVARAVAARRRIELVLICVHANEANHYRGANGEETLYERLERGAAPEWLRPVVLPPALAGGFRLFAAAP